MTTNEATAFLFYFLSLLTREVAMPNFFAYRVLPDPKDSTEPVYELEIAPPPGRSHRDYYTAFFGQDLKDTWIGQGADNVFVDGKGDFFVSVRHDDEDKPGHQTNPLYFPARTSGLRRDSQIHLGWDSLETYFTITEGDWGCTLTLKVDENTVDNCVPF